MTSPSLPSSFMINKEVRFRRLGEESVVIHQGNCKVLVLNDVGTRILELIDEKMPTKELFQTLINEYDVEAAELHSDLHDHIRELLKTDIIYKINNELPEDSK